MWRAIGTCLERPSRRARASERFDFRTRAETDEVAFVATERRRMASGAGVREVVRDGRGTSRGSMGAREGRRGGADLAGTMGRVAKGAGLGDGIDLKETESETLLEKDELGKKMRR
jgi:hypothetical protein